MDDDFESYGDAFEPIQAAFVSSPVAEPSASTSHTYVEVPASAELASIAFHHTLAFLSLIGSLGLVALTIMAGGCPSQAHYVLQYVTSSG